MFHKTGYFVEHYFSDIIILKYNHIRFVLPLHLKHEYINSHKSLKSNVLSIKIKNPNKFALFFSE